MLDPSGPIELLEVVYFAFFLVLGLGLVGWMAISAARIWNLTHLVADPLARISVTLYIGLGCYLLYLESAIALGFFTPVAVVAPFVIGLVYVLFKSRRELTVQSLAHSAKPIIFLLVVLTGIAILRMPLYGRIYGLFGDGSFHASAVDRIMSGIAMNPSYPVGTPPYPFGTHALGAAFGLVSGVPVHKIVPIMTAVFSILTFLGMYSLAYSIVPSRYLSFFAGLVATTVWYEPIDTIGFLGLGIAFATYALPTTLSCVPGLVRGSRYSSSSIFVMTAILLIPLSSSYPSSLVFVIAWAGLFILVDRVQMRFKFQRFAVVAFASLVSIALSYGYLMRSIGPGVTASLQVAPMNLRLQRSATSLPLAVWQQTIVNPAFLAKYFQTYSASAFSTGVALSMLVVLLVFSFCRRRVRSGDVANNRILGLSGPFIVAMLVFTNLLGVASQYYTPFLAVLPTDRLLALGQVFLLTGSILGLWALLSILASAYGVRTLNIRVLDAHVRVLGLRFLSAGLIILLVSSQPFLMTSAYDSNLRAVSDHLSNNLLVTKNDAVLMEWTRRNVGKEHIVLVFPADAGIDLGVTTHTRTVGPSYSQTELVGHLGPDEDYRRYIALVRDLILTPESEEVLISLVYFNVSYVFTGEFVSANILDDFNEVAARVLNGYQIPEYDSSTLLGYSRFEVVAAFGNARLFRVLYAGSPTSALVTRSTFLDNVTPESRTILPAITRLYVDSRRMNQDFEF